MVEPAEPEILKEKIQFPLRPKANPNWKPKEIALESNHFKLTVKNPKVLVKVYAIAFEPELPKDFRSGVYRLCNFVKKPISEWLKASFYVAGRNMFTTSTQEDDKMKSFEVTYSETKYVVNFKKTRETSLSGEIFSDNNTAAAARQYLNIVMKKILRTELKLTEWGINSKFYDLKNKESISQYGLSIYQGFKTSCEVYANFIPRLLIDISSRIIRDETANDLIKSFNNQDDILDALVGRSVVANYANQRMYRVDDVNFKIKPTSTFRGDDGKDISYMDYYKKKYGITIKDVNQPLLMHEARDKKILYLIPELMNLTGLTSQMRGDFRVMKKVAEYTRLEPDDRYGRLRTMSAKFKKLLENEGLSLEEKSKVTGFKLPPPEIRLGTKSFTPDRGNYQLRDPIRDPANFSSWVIVYHKSNYNEAGDLEFNLKKASGAYGIKVGPCDWLEITDTKSTVWAERVAKYLADKPKTQIVVVLIPPPAKNTVYPAIKRVCTRDAGYPSQVVVTGSLSKNTLSVCSKILLQMNAKVGQALWHTALPSNWGKKKAMIIGVDVSHNTGDRKKSCIGFCASLDNDFTRYFAKIKKQPKVGQEFIPNLVNLVKEAILRYMTVNSYPPDLIIMYRDGVGEAQIPLVMEIETNLITKMFETIHKDYKPEFAEIIVNKKIDDRFFYPNAKGEQGNPLSGTVVARDVVTNHFDFFLVAQDVNMGSCTPTHYNVIYNKTSLTEDQFYELTYRQCFNYYNWNGPIRVPAAVMYAHKLGFLVGQTYRDEHNEKLDEKLFFL